MGEPVLPPRSARAVSPAGRLAGRVVLAAVASVPLTGSLSAQASAGAETRAVERAGQLRDSGRHHEARELLIARLRAEPASPDALRLLLDLSGETGELASFVAEAEQASRGTGGTEPSIRGLWMRGLIAAGLPDSARAAAARWREERPGEPAAHRWLAEAHLAGADTARALDVLTRATGASPEDRAILERLAELLAATGDLDGLVASWARLLEHGEPGAEAVVQGALALARTDAAPRDALWRRVIGRSGAVADGAVAAALRLGEGEAARRLAEAADFVGVNERAAFFRQYVREADEAGLPAEVAWAAERLIGMSPRPVDRLRWRAMSADMALVAGDTSGARRAFRDLARESRPGDAAHGLATRRLFSLLAADPATLAQAESLWTEHERQYPDSVAARAVMAAELSMGRARAGDMQGAENVLRRAAVDLESAEARATIDAAAARIALFQGSLDSAVVRLRRAAAVAGPAAERTRRLGLLALLETITPEEVEPLGGALLGMSRDPGGWDPLGWLDAIRGVPPGPGRPALLSHVATELTEVGRQDDARVLLLRVADGYPASPEAPAALLSLARTSPPADARAWLERLITTYPDSALAPLARRLLAELDLPAAGP